MIRKHEVNTILIALLTAQGVFEKFKMGQKLTQREKVLCLIVFINAMMVSQNIYDRSTGYLPDRMDISCDMHNPDKLCDDKV